MLRFPWELLKSPCFPLSFCFLSFTLSGGGELEGGSEVPTTAFSSPNLPKMSNEDDRPCLAHLGDSVSEFTTKLCQLPWVEGITLPPFSQQMAWLSNHHLCTFLGHLGSRDNVRYSFPCIWSLLASLLRMGARGGLWRPGRMGECQPGSAVAPGTGSALTLTSCVISFLPVALQTCQRVGCAEGEGGKLWGRMVLSLPLEVTAGLGGVKGHGQMASSRERQGGYCWEGEIWLLLHRPQLLPLPNVRGQS